MKRKNERKLMNEAIRFGSVCVLALGIAVTVQGARAASSDRAALSGDLEEAIQPTSVTRNDNDGSGDVESIPSANAVAIPGFPPGVTCCVASRRGPFCTLSVSALVCTRAGGRRVSDCGCCYNECWEMTSDEGAKESEATAGSNVGSGWALMTIGLLLLPVVSLARFRA
jgi:hypothetical protein